MKTLPKIAKCSISELSHKNIKPLVASVVAGVLAGVSIPAMASINSETPTAVIQPQAGAVHTPQQSRTATILVKPSLEGQAFAAHYSHSSHASHSSHYSCTPGSTC